MLGATLGVVKKAAITAINIAAAINTLLFENSFGSCTKAGTIKSNAIGKSGTKALIKFKRKGLGDSELGTGVGGTRD